MAFEKSREAIKKEFELYSIFKALMNNETISDYVNNSNNDMQDYFVQIKKRYDALKTLSKKDATYNIENIKKEYLGSTIGNELNSNFYLEKVHEFFAQAPDNIARTEDWQQLYQTFLTLRYSDYSAIVSDEHTAEIQKEEEKIQSDLELVTIQNKELADFDLSTLSSTNDTLKDLSGLKLESQIRVKESEKALSKYENSLALEQKKINELTASINEDSEKISSMETFFSTQLPDIGEEVVFTYNDINSLNKAVSQFNKAKSEYDNYLSDNFIDSVTKWQKKVKASEAAIQKYNELDNQIKQLNDEFKIVDSNYDNKTQIVSYKSEMERELLGLDISVEKYEKLQNGLNWLNNYIKNTPTLTDKLIASDDINDRDRGYHKAVITGKISEICNKELSTFLDREIKWISIANLQDIIENKLQEYNNNITAAPYKINDMIKAIPEELRKNSGIPDNFTNTPENINDLLKKIKDLDVSSVEKEADALSDRRHQLKMKIFELENNKIKLKHHCGEDGKTNIAFKDGKSQFEGFFKLGSFTGKDDKFKLEAIKTLSKEKIENTYLEPLNKQMVEHQKKIDLLEEKRAKAEAYKEKVKNRDEALKKLQKENNYNIADAKNALKDKKLELEQAKNNVNRYNHYISSEKEMLNDYKKEFDNYDRNEKDIVKIRNLQSKKDSLNKLKSSNQLFSHVAGCAKELYGLKNVRKGTHINSKEYNQMIDALHIVSEWNDLNLQNKLKTYKNAPKDHAEALELLHEKTNAYLAAKNAQNRSNPSALRRSRLGYAEAIKTFAETQLCNYKNDLDYFKNKNIAKDNKAADVIKPADEIRNEEVNSGEMSNSK